MEWVILGAAAWFGCGFLAYGLTLAYFWREYPINAEHRRGVHHAFAALMFVSGPFGLFTALFGKHHGFMWHLPPRSGPC